MTSAEYFRIPTSIDCTGEEECLSLVSVLTLTSTIACSIDQNFSTGFFILSMRYPASQSLFLCLYLIVLGLSEEPCSAACGSELSFSLWGRESIEESVRPLLGIINIPVVGDPLQIQVSAATCGSGDSLVTDPCPFKGHMTVELCKGCGFQNKEQIL